MKRATFHCWESEEAELSGIGSERPRQVHKAPDKSLPFMVRSALLQNEVTGPHFLENENVAE